ncbi:hypothetical protein B7P43_G01487 [Cryptotermes secundus]|uniref:Aminopeptidase n=1 Tax=Cryptotermes secundus TaxID=105785 RepID=A0A2J7RK94_9NEOP|nr:hypothetical protein B7P43_G01487 [Cryptotermes secundus]
MLQVVWVAGAALFLLAAATVGTPAGKVLHSKLPSGEVQGYEDKPAAGRLMSRRSVDLRDAKAHVDDSRLPRDVTPTAYHLDLHPFPEEGFFKGRVQINVTCHEATNIIILHAHENLRIAHSEVTVKQLVGRPASQPKDPNVKADYPFSHRGNGSSVSSVLPVTISSTKKEPSKQWYVISLADKLKKDMVYQLDLSFTGTLTSDTTQGFFRASYQLHRTKEERWFAATKMAPSNARLVFPCFDEPELKASFEISVARTSRMTALSNMPVRSIDEMRNETEWSWVHFQETPLMSTFSVAVVLLDLETISTHAKGGVRVSVFARPSFLSQVQDVLRKACLMLEFMENYLTVPFPLPKLDLVALPYYSDPEPADLWGLIILKESDFVNEEGLSWRLAVEVAQQWLGHLATPAWWNDSRIKKALANYVASMAAEQDKLNWNPVTGYSLYYEYSKRHPYAGLGSQEEYIKVTRLQWLLRMLNYTLTEATFRDGLRTFVQGKKFKTFNEDELWEALTSQAREDMTLEESISVQEIVKSWVTKDRFPVVTVARDYQDNSASVEQHVFLKDRPQDMCERDSLLWCIPLIYMTADNLDVSAPRDPVVWMKEERYININNLPGPDFFIIVNPDEIGMFMVNYDQQNWALLLDYLRGPGPQIPPATRAKLLHDAWNLAYGGELDMATALNMTLFLERETDPIVWEVMFTMIDHLGRRISGTDAGLKFEEYARFLLARLVESLGAPQPDDCSEKTELRSRARVCLCQLGHQPCVVDARDAYSKWMQAEDPDAGNLVPDPYLCTVFQWGTMEEWEFGLKRVIRFPSDRRQSERHYLLKTLAGCPRQEEKVERILNVTLLEDGNNFTDSDIRLVLNMLTGRSTGYTTLFHFLSQNWEQLRERYVHLNCSALYEQRHQKKRTIF